MSDDLEAEFIGEESHLVPLLDPDDECNGKKTENIDHPEDGTRTLFRGYCNNKAGKGTDHVGEGRCKHHGGAATGGGAPAHNQNAQSNALTVDPHHYHENLPPTEQEWIDNTTAAILDRIRRRHRRDPDFLDRIMARSVAIEFHILSKARDYTKDELVQVIVHDGNSHEEKGALVEEVRRYSNGIIQNLKQLGILEDPESKKADALGEWRQFVSQGQQDTVELPEEPDSSD